MQNGRELSMKYDRYVVAYDIVSTKRRNKVAKVLKGWGERVNLSVFECELKKGTLELLRKEISKLIKKDEDVVVYYPLCLNCRAEVVNDGKKIERLFDKMMLTV